MRGVWTDLRLRLRALFHPRRAESEMEEELRFHVEMEERKLRAAGMAETEARQRARAHFGAMDALREECREVRGLSLLENLFRDLRYGLRMLRRSPLFTAIAVASLAIGIGANTAVFSLVDAILLRTLPGVADPRQLTVLQWGAAKPLNLRRAWSRMDSDSQGGWIANVFSWQMFTHVREQSRTFSEVMGFAPLGPVNLASSGQAFPAGAMLASGNYFHTLGVRAMIGRVLTQDDYAVDGVPAAVLSHRFWSSAMGQDAGIVDARSASTGSLASSWGSHRRDSLAFPLEDSCGPRKWTSRFPSVGATVLWVRLGCAWNGSATICSGSRQWAGGPRSRLPV